MLRADWFKEIAFYAFVINQRQTMPLRYPKMVWKEKIEPEIEKTKKNTLQL